MGIFQETIKIKSEIKTHFINILPQLEEFLQKSLSTKNGDGIGLLNIFVPHTTAGITLNENTDPDVRRDMTIGLEKISPEHSEYRHNEKNSFAHLKSTLIGTSLTLPVRNGKLWLGTWQTPYFCEFDGPRNREARITLYT